MPRRRKNTGDNLIALGQSLTALSQVGVDLLGGLEWLFNAGPRSQREQIHLEGQLLKNQLTAERIRHEHEKRQVTANREIKTGLDIDAATLKIRREEFKQVTAGILPAKDAQFYKRPPMSAAPEEL